MNTIARLKRELFLKGLTFWQDIYVSHVPDRFCKADKQFLASGGRFGTDLIERFILGNKYNNSGDLTRLFFLALVCDQIVKESIRGDMAELGVYKGNTATILARLAKEMRSKAYLFDTYEGFPDQDLRGIDQNKRPEFGDTSLEAVRAFVDSDAAIYVKGYFPNSTLGHVPDDAKFSLVHIDCDLYAPFTAALKYFYPRLVPGGFLIMHDYSSLYWDGAETAVDRFFEDKSECLIPVPDKSGTVVVRKSRSNHV